MGKLYITQYIEAFAVLQIENNLSKWEAMFSYDWADNGGEKKQFMFRETNRPGPTKEPKNEYIYLDTNPKFRMKFTRSNSGQAKLPGISTEGLSRYIVVEPQIDAGCVLE